MAVTPLCHFTIDLRWVVQFSVKPVPSSSQSSQVRSPIPTELDRRSHNRGLGPKDIEGEREREREGGKGGEGKKRERSRRSLSAMLAITHGEQHHVTNGEIRMMSRRVVVFIGPTGDLRCTTAIDTKGDS